MTDTPNTPHVTTGEGQRLFLVKPGDSIVFGNIGELDEDSIRELDELGVALKRTLKLRNVFCFESDIDMAAVNAE